MNPSRGLVVAGLVTVSTVALASPATGALPRPDAVYFGPTDLGGKVRIVAETKRNLQVVKVTDECGQVTRFRDVTVRSAGTFRAVKKKDGAVVRKIVGEFVSRDEAEGTFSQDGCQGDEELFEAERTVP